MAVYRDAAWLEAAAWAAAWAAARAAEAATGAARAAEAAPLDLCGIIDRVMGGEK